MTETSWYVVVSAAGALEDTRESCARALEFAADQVRRAGYSGGNYATPGSGGGDAVDLEVHLALGGPPELANVQTMDLDVDGGAK
jgi:hypothetical protein